MTLVWFIRHRADIPFRWMFWMFGAFIIGCGTTHLMDVITTVVPVYRLSGLVKLLTAVVSVVTAIALVPLVPRALALRSPAELEKEVAQRRAAEEVLARQAADLREQAELLRRASTAKDTFLATMSHELRTPLNAILGFTGTLLMRLPGPLNEEQHKQLSIVQTSGRHLLSLINDLLDLSKIESGTIEVGQDPVVILDTMRLVASTLQPLAEAKGLRIAVMSETPDAVMQTDRHILLQILLNLVNNAIKFTETGSIRIQSQRRTEGARQVTEIRVTDTGIGIRAEDMSGLFRVFTQVGATRQRQEGSGLGLHLSRKLAELLGATITVHSEYGKGSTFTLAWSQTAPPALTP